MHAVANRTLGVANANATALRYRQREMSAPEPRQFSLVLRAEPGIADPLRELRQLLKLALRRHGFRCLLCAPEPARAESGGADETTTGRHDAAGGNLKEQES